MNDLSRRVGVEIEFAGLSFDQASEVVGGWLGAEPTVVSPHEHEFEAEPGVFRLEVDFELLKHLSREEFESKDASSVRRMAVDVLDAVAGLATPLELVTPPLAEPDLKRLESLQDALEESGAVGTRESLLHGFGVHFNPQAELDHKTITDHLRAFLCLYEWLKEEDSTDLTRQVTSYIDPYPQAYERELLDPDFAPSQAALIDHYLRHNPTRNRALDMLPLFAELDPERVADSVEDDRIKPRPTYHYRLPNSGLGEPGWSILDPWRGWLAVEKLAADEEQLSQLCRARLKYLERDVVSRLRGDWVAQCRAAIDAR